ncbi:MAG: glycogen/starch/alpha-glucan phosphorylase [Verrucomicrobiales bacterium]|jgi:starch phosphorylase|nr:glycogen/starch/alpha-glucan phosphorylase [Verrucomicrobiales bacterium]
MRKKKITENAVPSLLHGEPIRNAILRNLRYGLARDLATASRHDWWFALSKTTQERIIERLIATQAEHGRRKTRRVYYLSLEFLVGRLLGNNLLNIGIYDEAVRALEDLSLDLREVRDEEYDMALGNGGLGRLAACFLDSLATLSLPAVGYGINYEFGLFKQEFRNGYQIERPDEWMQFGDAWEITRASLRQEVHLFGRVENVFDGHGDYRAKWVDTRVIVGVPHDVPVCGYDGCSVNFLRLWRSHAKEELDFQAFNAGGYVEALQNKNLGEVISKVLYPNDSTENGKELRLVQQYFFVACSLRDILRRFHREHGDNIALLPEKAVIQLNDTHPAIAVAELMRLLLDEYNLPWAPAWDMVTRIFAYTNHTLMPEALERWSVPLFQKVLPRHLQIIFDINSRFLKEVEAKWPGDSARQRELSLVEEGPVKMLRMAHLAVVGSFSVNGVAELHTRLLKQKLFKSFHELWPRKINNVTNGVTPRRWLLSINGPLSDFITGKIGDEWVTDLDQLRRLEQFADDPAVLDQIQDIKLANKTHLAMIIQRECGVTVSPEAIFDVQIKRLHEYKRQHLNLLYILTLYRRLLQNPDYPMTPRVFIFGAKAAPGYQVAKCIIKAINSVAEVINHDPRINGKLKVVFMPNYRVSLASLIIPAADVSEQISTAGKEASGTGNMKLGLNGAVTIGTLDGANVEILAEVGADNIFIFGLKVEEVEELRARGYHPYDYYNTNAELRAAIDWLGSRHFIPHDPHDALAPLLHSLLDGGDPFMVLADYADYARAQDELDQVYRDRRRWARMSLLNTARLGKFSSDRSIRDYARDIWKLAPVEIP